MRCGCLWVYSEARKDNSKAPGTVYHSNSTDNPFVFFHLDADRIEGVVDGILLGGVGDTLLILEFRLSANVAWDSWVHLVETEDRKKVAVWSRWKPRVRSGTERSVPNKVAALRVVISLETHAYEDSEHSFPRDKSRIQRYCLLWPRHNVEATFEEVGSTAKEGKITLLQRNS